MTSPYQQYPSVAQYPTVGQQTPPPFPVAAQQYMPAAPAPAQYAPPVFIDPTPVNVDPSPAMRHLEGRVVAFEPTHYDPTAAGVDAGTVRPRITANLIVSGVGDQGQPMGPIEFGDNRTTGTPNAHRVSVFPAEFTGTWIQNDQVVKVLEPAVPDPRQNRAGGVIIAKVVRGTQGRKGNPPFLLEAVPAEHPARAELTAAFNARHADRGALKRPIEPLQPAAAPGAGYPGAPVQQYPPQGLPPQVNYGQAPTAAPAFTAAAPMAAPAGPAPAPVGAPRQGGDGGWYVAPTGWPEQAWQTIPNPEAYGTRVG